MAHWNPYYSGPNTQNNTFYENQNQQFYNTLPYGVPYQQYDAYYMQNATNFMPNTPVTIRTAREVEAEQLLYSQNQQIAKTNDNERTSNQAVLTSNLTATAAEFKPSSSNSTVPIKSQTFSNNNYKSNENSKSRNYDYREKSKENEPGPSGPSKPNENPQNHSKNKGNFMKFNNKKPYNKSDSDRNYSSDRYNRSKDREDKFKSTPSSKNDSRQESNTKTGGSGRFPNRDNYYNKNNRYNRNGENNYRNNYDYNER